MPAATAAVREAAKSGKMAPARKRRQALSMMGATARERTATEPAKAGARRQLPRLQMQQLPLVAVEMAAVTHPWWGADWLLLPTAPPPRARSKRRRLSCRQGRELVRSPPSGRQHRTAGCERPQRALPCRLKILRTPHGAPLRRRVSPGLRRETPTSKTARVTARRPAPARRRTLRCSTERPGPIQRCHRAHLQATGLTAGVGVGRAAEALLCRRRLCPPRWSLTRASVTAPRCGLLVSGRERCRRELRQGRRAAPNRLLLGIAGAGSGPTRCPNQFLPPLPCPPTTASRLAETGRSPPTLVVPRRWIRPRRGRAKGTTLERTRHRQLPCPHRPPAGTPVEGASPRQPFRPPCCKQRQRRRARQPARPPPRRASDPSRSLTHPASPPPAKAPRQPPAPQNLRTRCPSRQGGPAAQSRHRLTLRQGQRVRWRTLRPRRRRMLQPRCPSTRHRPAAAEDGEGATAVPSPPCLPRCCPGPLPSQRQTASMTAGRLRRTAKVSPRQPQMWLVTSQRRWRPVRPPAARAPRASSRQRSTRRPGRRLPRPLSQRREATSQSGTASWRTDRTLQRAAMPAAALPRQRKPWCCPPQ